MIPKSAIEILFEKTFEGFPLFKNQMELVTELLSDVNSKYYTPKENKEEYTKAVSRLKAYISQLLSDTSRRTVTNEFKYSLNLILKSKFSGLNTIEIGNEIINDLQESNRKKSFTDSDNSKKELLLSGFYENLFDAHYVSIFTTREIKFEFEIGDKVISLANLLIDEFLNSFIEKSKQKKYRFNFPLEQMCFLFWRSFHKEIVKVLNSEKASLILSNNLNKFTNINSVISDNKTSNKSIQDNTASEILSYVSKENIISVYHLKSPIYSTPSIALNPNDRSRSATYLLLQSDTGEEVLHKLKNDELLYWKIFVWDNLKINNSGKLIKYSASY